MDGRPVDSADDGLTRRDARWSPHSRQDWLFLFGIMAVAFVVRALPLFRGAGLDGHLGYDDGVYFGAAVALTNGVLPYRDFLLLHPPGIAVLLSPFALIAGATSDATGFALARLAFMTLGAVNAGLVAVAAGRYGRRAGLLGGLLYAVWFSAARVERTTDLIGPQTTLLLIAMLIVTSSRRLTTRRAAVAGVVLGLAAAIQVWGGLPVVVIAGAIWLQARAGRPDPWRPAVALLAGAAVGFGAVCLPFFLAAPSEFIRYVFIDQLARPNLGVTLLSRLRALEGLSITPAATPSLVNSAVLVLAIVGAGAVVLVARRVPEARLWVALLVLETAYLVVAPNFFSHYSAWIAPAAAVVLGTAAALVIEAVRQFRALGMVTRVAWIGVAAALALGIPRHQGTILPVASLDADLSAAHCVSADTPDLLVLTSGLLRDIQDRCPVVLDPTGVSYETDRGHLSNGPISAARLAAPGYQHAMEEYYDDSNAAMFSRSAADGLTPATEEEISDDLPDVVKQGPITIMLPGPTTLP